MTYTVVAHFFHIYSLRSSMPVLCWCLDIAHLDLFLRNQIVQCVHINILCVRVLRCSPRSCGVLRRGVE